MKTSTAIATVAATCINQFAALGFCYAAGVYQVVFLERFSAGVTFTSWIMSVLLGMLCFGGPVASLMIGRYGCGVTVFCGSLLSSIGFCCSSFATSVAQLIAMFGFVAGTGSSLVFTASVVVIPERFTEHRILAAALSVSGAGIGTVLWPWITRFLIEMYGWRGALLISSGVTLQGCVTGMVLSVDDSQSLCKSRKTSKNSEQIQITPETKVVDQNEDLKHFKEKKKYISSIDAENPSGRVLPLHRSLMDIQIQNSHQNINLLSQQQKAVSCYIEGPSGGKREKREKRKILADSFQSASFSSLPELYQSAVLENKANLENPATSQKSQAWQITKDVFKDLNFILLSGNVLLFCFGFSVLYTHIAAYAASIGLNITQRNTVFSALGISNILGRVLLGLIGNQNVLNIIALYAGCYVFAGVGTLGMAWWQGTVGLSVCGVLVGLGSAAYGPVLTEVTCVLLGAHRFYLAYGYLLVFMGIGSVIGAPIAGFAYDCLQFYPASLYIGGAAFVFAGLVILPSYNFAKK